MSVDIAPRHIPDDLSARVAGAIEQYVSLNLKQPKTIEIGCWDLQHSFGRSPRPEMTIWGVPIVEVHGHGIRAVGDPVPDRRDAEARVGRAYLKVCEATEPYADELDAARDALEALGGACSNSKCRLSYAHSGPCY